jgi:hypothetical protein
MTGREAVGLALFTIVVLWTALWVTFEVGRATGHLECVAQSRNATR